ncbi:hypothetical protein T439DRAFT_355237 [Meredithblackwellia eburnea MCA 4105]
MGAQTNLSTVTYAFALMGVVATAMPAGLVSPELGLVVPLSLVLSTSHRVSSQASSSQATLLTPLLQLALSMIPTTA